MENRTRLNQSHQLKELIESEKVYGKHLEALKDTLDNSESIYSAALSSLTKSLHEISTKAIANLEESQELLQKETASALDKNDIKKRAVLSLERVILIDKFFTVLEQYTNSYINSIEQQKANPKMLKQANKHNEYAQERYQQAFDALLINPIQRGPRYVMLLSEIAKFIEKNPQSADERQKEMIISLCDKIKNQLAEMNANIKEINDNADKPKEYEFGDYTYAFLNKISSMISVTSNASEQPESQAEKRGYQFGDLTRSAGSYLSSFFTKTADKKESNDEEKEKDNLKNK